MHFELHKCGVEIINKALLHREMTFETCNLYVLVNLRNWETP